MNLCDNDVDGLTTVFTDKFEEIQRSGATLVNFVWVLPRVETSAHFKRQWQAFHGGGPMLTPHIITADRLSQPRSRAGLLVLQTQLVELLSNKPWLTKSSSPEQWWGLAGECLELAMRLVLVEQAKAAVDQYMTVSDHAQLEASIVLEVAKVFHQELLDLWVKPARANFRDAQQVIWFDDGEPLPGLWLKAFVPHLPLERVALPLIAGSQPWEKLAGHLAASRNLSISLAPDVATQAQQAAACIKNWLDEDAQGPIVVAVVDRLAARRLVPVLAQLGVWVDDRTGWKFSTSRVAGWFKGLLDSYALHGQLVQLPGPLSADFIVGFDGWGVGQAHSLAQWSIHWLELFERVDITDSLSADAAGTELLRTLRDLSTVSSQTLIDCNAFAAAWAHQAEQARFKPQDVTSPVRLMPLLTTRLQDKARTLVLGAGQSHFKPNPPGLLPPTVAAELGFPGPGLHREQLISALFELISGSHRVAIFHAQTAGGRPESLLPELQWLDIAVRKQCGDNAGDVVSAQLLQGWPDSSISADSVNVEPFSLSNGVLSVSPPSSLKVTALDTWVACRLQFGLKYGLVLEPSAQIVDKTYYQLRGIYVHRVLELAAQRVAPTDKRSLVAWKQALADAGREVLQSFTAMEQATVYPFYEYFQGLYPRIAGVLIERHSQGWSTEGVEQQAKGKLTLSSGAVIHMSGRMDRLERSSTGLSIVDIKYKSESDVKKWVSSPQDFPQLAAYQQLLGDPNAQLAFLAVHKQGTAYVQLPAPEDGASWGEKLWQSLAIELDTFFRQDASWDAQPGEHCQRCDYAGVCRPIVVDAIAQDEANTDE